MPEIARTTGRQKVGLTLAALFSLANAPSVVVPGPDGDDPMNALLVVASLVGVLGVVTAVLAWRGNAVALRVCAGAVVVLVLTSVPAFFVDVPVGVKALVAMSVIVMAAALVLMFSGDRRPAAALDERTPA